MDMDEARQERESEPEVESGPAEGSVEAEETELDEAPEIGDRAFLQQVRAAAGWRVSPRQMAAALEAIEARKEEPTPERVAKVVGAIRGEPSARQRRGGDLWRALGAQLVVQGESGDPEAQRAFIGDARTAAKRPVSDTLLLTVALLLSVNGRPINPELVGKVTRKLRQQLPADASMDELERALPQAIQAVRKEQRAQRAPRRSVNAPLLPQRGRVPRGASPGGKRRRRV